MSFFHLYLETFWTTLWSFLNNIYERVQIITAVFQKDFFPEGKFLVPRILIDQEQNYWVFYSLCKVKIDLNLKVFHECNVI